MVVRVGHGAGSQGKAFFFEKKKQITFATLSRSLLVAFVVPRMAAAQPMQPGDWSLAPAKAGLDLSLSASDRGVEEITVIGQRRRKRLEAPDPNKPVTFGPATITSILNTSQPDRTGLTVTTAIPIAAIPGMDAVINVAGESGGSEQRNTGAPVVTGGPPIGLRLKF